MVGIPGKSKGCSTCRERKIRCDLRKPACNHCQRTRRICGGYTKSIIFINKSSQGFDPHSRGIQDVTCRVSSPSSALSDLQQYQDSHLRPVPGSLDATPLLQNGVLAEFVNATLPKGTNIEPPLSWITTILGSATYHETLSLAGSAIGHGWIGHVEGQHDHVSRGRRCYVQAIRCLRRDLDKRLVPNSEAILATASALVLYELIEFGTHDAQGWLAHTSGIEVIIFQASAQAFIAGSSHRVFLFCRVVIILRSLLHRRSTFLKGNEWRHVPWTLYPKNPFHQLLDLVTETTALLEICDTQEASWGAGICEGPTTRHLLIRIALTISRLRCWYMDSDIHLPGDSLLPLANRDDGTVPKTPLETPTSRHWYPARHYPKSRVSFELLQQTRLMLFYWAVVLTLQSEVFRNHALRTELYQICNTLDDADSNPDIQQDIRASISIDLAIEHADNIVKWFEFAAQDVWNSFGPAFGVFSLKAAIFWYSIHRNLPGSHTSSQSDRSTQYQQAQSMLLRLVNHGSPPTWRV